MQYPLFEAHHLTNHEALSRFLKAISDKKLSLYESQEEAILEIFEDRNVILSTPTGSGKSLVALALHYRSLTSGRRSFYSSPIKALVNEKFFALCKEFGPERVGIITGDASVNPHAPIICCTAEILANMALREGDRSQIDDVVIDEFHYYADRDRGVSWQIPLLTLPQSRFLLMSATMGSTDFFEEALTKLTGRKTVLVHSTVRPVPLEFSYSEYSLEVTVENLVNEGKSPLYIVNFTQREASENAQSFLSLNFASKAEKEAISLAIQGTKFSTPFGKDLNKLLRHGIGVHHAGLLPKYRILVEGLAQQGLLKLILGTDTLGVGVNVPIRCVLFTKLAKYDGTKHARLSVRDFHQISGRAGRKGFDNKGWVVAMAPQHVIENKKLERKAKENPKAAKKMVRAKPPEKGYVHWDETIYRKLIDSAPEKLNSSFQITHATLLNVLSRTYMDGCHAMKGLLKTCHETPVMKAKHRARSFQLFRSLKDRKIIELIPKDERTVTKVRVNADLQEDFTLHHALSLYFLDTLKYLDPFDELYAFNLLSLAESIVEDPTAILIKQLDKLKGEKIAEMKEAGMEYEERMTELEKLEYPKPLRDFIYDSFNTFARKHPWVGQENIKPKSIAREIYETYQSFSEYVSSYGLQRSEGLLLRHLSGVYKILVQTLPEDLKNDTVDEMILYFETMIKSTDSSLLDEWEKLKDPTNKSKAVAAQANEEVLDVTRQTKVFANRIRNIVFSIVRALGYQNYSAALALIEEAADFDLSAGWTETKIKEMLAPFYEDHKHIRLDPSARLPKYTSIYDGESKDERIVEHTLVDSEGHNDWVLKFKIDLPLSRKKEKPILRFEQAGPVHS